MDIKTKKLSDLAKMPTFGTAFSAGADLYAAIDFDTLIPPHKTILITTGLSMAIPAGYFGAIFARSGLATKQGLRPANCVGVIDADYRGPIMVALHNDTDEDQVVQPGSRIAQMIIMECPTVSYEEVEDLDNTERGAGGFGSTGVN